MRVRPLRLTAVAAFVALALVVVAGPTLEGQEPRGKAALMNPADLIEQAPATFKVNFDTSAGSFVVEVHRDWAPIGVDRFYNLVKRGFYDGSRFHRVIPDYMAQSGIHGDPEVTKVWLSERILDDPRGKQSNVKGTVAFVGAGMNRRSTQIYINLADNKSMDRQIPPIGRVASGMEVVGKLYAGYGEVPPTGNGPEQNRLTLEGNAYLEKEFPKLDYIKTATILPGS